MRRIIIGGKTLGEIKRANRLVCPKCGKYDHTTSTKMQCQDCKGLCRTCCPTGHGTRFDNDSLGCELGCVEFHIAGCPNAS